ncbi:NADH:ubiquinone oxidoreductase subunit NDUFA12 [Parasphingorhabdus litoris]|uniref:NADH:ubiquinone oxidoreductase subunit NDUFA12 n=1 Tax=Parasphingorhabdus litoris TaxID=394733 RepID=A0ABN1AVD4_9SPHN|nr:NADH:ubiquinone oxidoreductase subunit NDUFA12 [Parasphingorhabdus litoris]
MGILGKIFTWWDGATIGTLWFSARKGKSVGQDVFGNVYYQTKNIGKEGDKRWVIYSGSNDASRVPPEWHGWLHKSYDEVPESHLPQPRIWEKEPTGNLTGTAEAYRPAGALEAGGRRASATGDYEPWNPAEAE